MKFKNHIVPLIYDDYIVMVFRKEQNHKKQKKSHHGGPGLYIINENSPEVGKALFL
jgi:hypothetical protein